MKKIVAIPGSIRKESYNKSVCRYVEENHPDDVEVSIFELNDVPMFSEDLEENLPNEVEDLISAVKEADALIISTPEYNNMMPGVLKNTLEWLSRVYSREYLMDKPLLILGASTGGFGTVRAQNQLHLLASIFGMKVSSALKLPISHAREVFDENGELVDEDVKKRIDEKVGILVDSLK